MKTFANFKLARLLIPDLDLTCQRYLRSCEPLFASEVEKETTTNAVNNFRNGIGKLAQSRLVELDQKEPNSWLENIWLNKAYLEYREPSMINVNWWCQFKDAFDAQEQLLTHPPPKGVLSEYQIDRAARLTAGLLDFNNSLNK
jgi:carnitine O-acetyltransferase